MSTDYSAKINTAEPRVVWTHVLQLMYTIIAMIPIVYYLREIVLLPETSRYVLIALPVSIALILFFIQIQMNNYFWDNELIFKRRDIFVVALKSNLLIVGLFYFLFLLMFGYWFTGTEVYDNLGLNDVTFKVLFEAMVSILLVISTAVIMRSIQKNRLEL